jgi:hypothetical protein
MQHSAASVFSLGNVSYTNIEGFICTEKQTYKTVMQDWLGHIDIVNLELTVIVYWHYHTAEGLLELTKTI